MQSRQERRKVSSNMPCEFTISSLRHLRISANMIEAGIPPDPSDPPLTAVHPTLDAPHVPHWPPSHVAPDLDKDPIAMGRAPGAKTVVDMEKMGPAQLQMVSEEHEILVNNPTYVSIFGPAEEDDDASLFAERYYLRAFKNIVTLRGYLSNYYVNDDAMENWSRAFCEELVQSGKYLNETFRRESRFLKNHDGRR